MRKVFNGEQEKESIIRVRMGWKNLQKPRDDNK